MVLLVISFFHHHPIFSLQPSFLSNFSHCKLGDPYGMLKAVIIQLNLFADYGEELEVSSIIMYPDYDEFATNMDITLAFL